MVAGNAAAAIIRQDKYKPLDPKSSGMPIIAHDKTAFFKKEMSRTMGLSLIVSLVVLTLALRSFSGIVMTVIVTSRISDIDLRGYLAGSENPLMWA